MKQLFNWLNWSAVSTPREEEEEEEVETVSTIGLFLGIPIRLPFPRRWPRRLVLFLLLRCFLAETIGFASKSHLHFFFSVFFWQTTLCISALLKLVDGSAPNFHFPFFNISFTQHFQSFLEHVRPFPGDICPCFKINEYLQMVRLEYEPFFDFSKVKLQKKKRE